MNNGIAAVAALILSSLLVGQPPSGEKVKSNLPLRPKAVTKTALKPHPQPNQSSMDATGKHGDQDHTICEWDGSLYMEASLLSWEGNERTVSLALAIANTADQNPSLSRNLPTQVFAPSTMVVILTNGHSYRPFKQLDVLQQAYALAENGRLANTSSEPDSALSTTNDLDCSLTGDITTCRTTAEHSDQAGYIVGFALDGDIKNGFERHDAEKYIKQVKEAYLIPQQIPVGAHVVGYVDFYVEDVLKRGAQKARDEARKTMALVRAAVGMKAASVVA